MASTTSPLERRLASVSRKIEGYEQKLESEREMRDSLFLDLYHNRKLTVTDMAKIAGIRRESVHLALNRARKRRDGNGAGS